MLLRLGLILGLILVGCTSSPEEVSRISAAVVPPGSNASVASHTIPTTMAPGERRVVTVNLDNTGTGGASNTWTNSGPSYYLFRTSAERFGFVQSRVTDPIATGESWASTFVITAPSAPGAYTFSARMGIAGEGFFGDSVVVPITVSAAASPEWDCTFVSSTLPATMAPGEVQSISVTVQNSGTSSWTAGDFSLYSRDTPVALWGNTISPLTTTTAPGSNATFTFNVTAPGTAGMHSIRRQILDQRSPGVGFFSLTEHCFDQSVNVMGGAPFDAALVANTLPSTLAPGESRAVSITMQNTGANDWPADGTFHLYSRNSPTSLYGVTIKTVTVATTSGSNAVFTFTIQAPMTPGAYNQRWQMLGTGGAGFFGELVDVPLTVSDMVTPTIGATLVTQSVPALMTAGEAGTFVIEMQNSGTGDWTGSDFSLTSQNSPTSLWGVTGVALGGAETVASGSNKTFTINVVAPASPGSYSSVWRMLQLPGVGFFGPTVTSPVTVTLCGNGTIDAGEECDDDNLNDGDGCSSACEVQTMEYDLLSATMDRSFHGSLANRQLANVTIVDITGDSTPEVLVSENANVSPAMGSARALAGTVYGFAGGAGFFTNSTTTLPDTPTFRIFGADANDFLGATAAGALRAGDVNGDGTVDIVVSAHFADGEDDMRTDAGEVYVITAGAGLTGDIDLGAETAPTQLAARIIGANAGDRLSVLAVGNVTGDSNPDLVLGAPYEDTTNGTDSGAIYVVPGGATLTGTIDLSSASVIRIIGTNANARLGTSAAIGDYVGSSAPDLIVGNPNATIGGRSRTGAAYGFVGPIVGNRDVTATVGSASGPDLAWFGETQNDILGAAVAIANVAGTTEADVLIGSPQGRRAGTQVGAVYIWAGRLSSGSTFDLSVGGGQTATFRGAEAHDNAGSSLAAGDMNGDGYAEILVVSPLSDGPSNARDRSGDLAVYLGGSGVSGIVETNVAPPVIRILGGEAVDLLGAHFGNVSMADIDGDGNADLCVGTYQGGPSNVGRVDCLQSTL